MADFIKDLIIVLVILPFVILAVIFYIFISNESRDYLDEKSMPDTNRIKKIKDSFLIISLFILLSFINPLAKLMSEKSYNRLFTIINKVTI